MKVSGSKRIRAERSLMGGKPVGMAELPWAVAIFWNDEFRCTGTLISPKHVITAAHCFIDAESGGECSMTTKQQVVDSTKIQFGHNCLWGGGSCPPNFRVQTRKVSRAQFAKFLLIANCQEGDDLALLELVEMIGNAMPICLPNTFDLLDNWKSLPVIAYGWGTNPAAKQSGISKEMTGVSQRLMFVELYLMNKKRCEKNYERITEFRPKDVICTMEMNNKSVCMGDSGGGLIQQAANGRFQLLGITSFGTRCEDLLHSRLPGRGALFTDVREHMLTIQKFMNTEPPKPDYN